MKTKAILFAITVAVALASCGQEKKHDDNHSADQHATAEADQVSEAAAPQFKVDDAFQDQLGAVFTSYVGLKDAFVASDVEKVKSEAAETQQALKQVDMKLVTGAAHNDWMTYLGGMESAVKEIQTSDDLEAQRKSFSALSDNLYKSAKAFGLGGKEAFYEYCPMAFNNEGGYWLSDQEKVRNPYFGDKMLTCGEVREKIR